MIQRHQKTCKLKYDPLTQQLAKIGNITEEVSLKLEEVSRIQEEKQIVNQNKKELLDFNMKEQICINKN